MKLIVRVGTLLLVACSTAVAGVEMNGSWHEKTATRERFCLNGEWEFHPLEGDKKQQWNLPAELGRVDGYGWKMKMRVPGTWKAGPHHRHEYEFFESADVHYLKGCLRAWYRREFFVPAEWAGKDIVLEFGGVGYKAAVYVDRQLAGTHIGGITPFEVDITGQATPGRVNEILVYNTSFKHGWEVPEEGVMTPPSHFGGIWGDVYLRAGSRILTDNVFVKTSVRRARLTCVVEIVNRDVRARPVSVGGTVMDGGQAVLSMPEKQVEVPAGEMVTVELVKTWQNARCWSPEDPHLYHLHIRLRESGKLIDEKVTRFGFREFWIDGKDFRLNGEIVRLRNFPVPTDSAGEMRPEYIRGWFRLMKEKLHHNHIRFQWVFPDIYAEIADEVGLLVEEGTGFVGGHRTRWNWPESNATVKKEFGEWVRSKRNHPSIVIWSAENECWSMKDVKAYRAGDREAVGIYEWLLAIGEWITEHDDTRVLTYHNLGDMFDWTAGYFDEFLEAGDLMGGADNYNLHYPNNYRFVAEQAEVGTRWAEEKNKPLIVGEFGGPQLGVPGNSSDFVIRGEESLRGGALEAEAGYYFFRRAGGAWRAAGMSGIYPWYPNIYSTKMAFRYHRFEWDDLTTPYMKPVNIKNVHYNPGWDKSVPEYTPDNLIPESNNRYWDLLTDTFAPLLINLGGDYWEHNYLGGEKVVKTAHIVNDTASEQEVCWTWTLEEGGRCLAGDTQTVKIARSGIQEVGLEMGLPPVRKRTDLVLRLTAAAGTFHSHDRLDISVYPSRSVVPPEFPEARVALYDKAGLTARVLDRAGIGYERIEDIAAGLKNNHDVLIIGCDSADAGLTRTVAEGGIRGRIQDFVRSGGRAVVFEQNRNTFPNLDRIFPGITTPPIEHLSPSFHASSYADIAAPGHPVFKGLGRGVSLWKGEYGRIAEFHYPRLFGTRARPLLFSGRWSTALVEGSHGDGRYLLCQTCLTTRYELDPEATLLMHNMLSYALSPAPVVKARAATVGEVGGLMGGFEAADITGRLHETSLDTYDVIILGRDTMTAGSEVTGNSGRLLRFVENGGTMFALAQGPDKLEGGWLPGRVSAREMETQCVYKEATGSPLVWGVCDFDLTRYWAYGHSELLNTWARPKVAAEFHDWSPDWTSLLLVSAEPDHWNLAAQTQVGGVSPTGGSALLEAKYGRGRIILCQLDLDRSCSAIAPEAFEDMELHNLGPRMVADVLLANLGLAPGEGAGRAATVPVKRERIWAMKKLAGNAKAYPAAWRVIGPFENPQNRNFGSAQGPERDILTGKVPAESYPADEGEPLSWSVVAPDTGRNGLVDLDALYDRPEWVTAYATMTLKSPKVRRAVFFTGSDDGYRLWVNGTLVGELDTARGAVPMQEIHTIDLTAGDNVVLLKVTEHVGDFSFYFSMLDEDGSVLEDCVTQPGVSGGPE